ncbi:MAG: hypothetical protein HND47_16935 [Chloroflexi bacterium]|nr:hypothetical protein [Chloroflexota bacterium]
MFILPSALPVNQPELIGWDEPAMTFEYRYPVLQAGVLHRFVVAVHDLILDNLVWYSGAVIAKGENTALVKADTRAKRVTIKVKGAEETRKEFLYFIRLQFERIHGEEIKPEGFIYPPHCPNLPLPYEKIKKFLKAGTTTLDEIYEDKPVKINLRELLDGFITSEERRKDEEKEKLEARQKGPDKEDKSGDTYITNNISLRDLEGGNIILGEGHHVNQSIQNSFNAFPADVRNALADLMKAAETLLQQVEESEHKDEIREELESLQSEAKKSKPKKDRVKVTVESLAQAARNLNEIGKPVLELAVSVIKLINN